MTDAETQLLTMIVNRLDSMDARMTSAEANASESRGRMHQKQERQGELLLKIDHRLTTVEKAVDGAGPALREIAEMKVKAATAGALGRALWKIGRWVMAGAVAVYAIRHDLVAWWHWLVNR